jgi:hypothetical protein
MILDDWCVRAEIFEACLLEVAVKCEGFPDPKRSHDGKTQAVSETYSALFKSLVQAESRLFDTLVGSDHGDNLTCEQCIAETRGLLRRQPRPNEGD